jgi:hypothetical protein
MDKYQVDLDARLPHSRRGSVHRRASLKSIGVPRVATWTRSDVVAKYENKSATQPANEK